eukprot:1297667-Pleurochrysis_carterae.AAC.2
MCGAKRRRAPCGLSLSESPQRPTRQSSNDGSSARRASIEGRPHSSAPRALSRDATLRPSQQSRRHRRDAAAAAANAIATAFGARASEELIQEQRRRPVLCSNPASGSRRFASHRAGQLGACAACRIRGGSCTAHAGKASGSERLRSVSRNSRAQRHVCFGLLRVRACRGRPHRVVRGPQPRHAGSLCLRHRTQHGCMHQARRGAGGRRAASERGLHSFDQLAVCVDPQREERDRALATCAVPEAAALPGVLVESIISIGLFPRHQNERPPDQRTELD